MALMAVFLSSSLEKASRLVFWTKKSKKSRPAKAATMISSITVKPGFDFERFMSFIIAYFVI